jgi:iron-sulfur cluster insertion protein
MQTNVIMGDDKMKCVVSASAASRLTDILAQQEDKTLKIRVFVQHAHGDHAHYGLGLDTAKDEDELVLTESGLEVLLEKGVDFLDGIEIDYDATDDKWVVMNPSKGGHGHHHHH